MAAPTTEPRPTGVARARTLWRLWRNEREDPVPFYRLLADEAAEDLERRYGPLAGEVVADLGCGPGHYTRAFAARGATVVPVEGSLEELRLPGGPAPNALIGDAGRLPLPDDSVDGVFCSNMLEHTPDPAAVIAELGRVLKPGGWGYLSWTNWYSPWGGHLITPYHYLGPELGPRVHERLHGPPDKNRVGESLFAVHIGPTLREVAARPGLRITRVEPRYWPWAAWITRVPGLREVVTWNCVIRFTKVCSEEEARVDDDAFASTLASVADVEGWMSDDQARRLWDRARELGESGCIVEIGSYRGRSTTVLATAAAPGVEPIAIDPHAGNDRGPQQWEGTAEEGQSDYEVFHANLERAGVDERVRHVREFSQEALDEVEGEVDLLYIDGAHRYGPARADIERWGARVRAGGTMLIHDAFSSVGVTLALVAVLFFSARWRYVGRSRSMVEYRKEPVRGAEWFRNVGRQVAQLPWFVRNLVVKVLIVARLRPATRLLGHREETWPY